MKISKKNNSIKNNEIGCKDCELTKLSNPKHPVCNYHQGFRDGKRQEKDIKANLLADHYQKGKDDGEVDAIAEEMKFLKYLIDSYFLICVGQSPQTPRTDILLRIKTLKNEGFKKKKLKKIWCPRCEDKFDKTHSCFKQE